MADHLPPSAHRLIERPIRWWGTASSAVQVEGACAGDNWYAWERAGRAPESASGNGFAERYHDDLELLARWGFTDHRLSLNWARVLPDPDRVDKVAVDYYRDVLSAGRAAGLRMWVTLLHTALPQWFAHQGGFLGPEAGGHWRRWVDLVADQFGDLVDGWMPVNNPTSFAQKAYLTGTFPPGVRSLPEFFQALTAVHRADFDAASYLRGSGRPVCSNESLTPLVPADDSPQAAAAAAQWDAVVWESWLSLARSDEYADAFDHYGFSYYAVTAVNGSGEARPYPLEASPGPLGYVPWADGLAWVLQRLARELPGRSFVVAELGYGGDDEGRTDYLSRSLRHIDDARNSGVDVDGVFFWTGIDNYEWLAGDGVPFGLFDRERRPRRSAELVRRTAPSASGRLGGGHGSDGR
ncbi:beta-glucosidase [Micromonospora phaseoli]|uniref:Beta-glucosidase n=1 Tax=Micromonospora phaseoli TaxID=1144548 RepID=A0A1H6YJ41_9ACTN|nr:family 1 glycosylhydrolase [Micromonospora phaseoli]PZW00049.1 beta-glucosidase [Micromonospora phaseoli]GIJ80409.1 beta-glucosidase [Micromonospora phaseoli]SEJ36745.1 beta-glucosidase [Micromonospora phaseoli]